MGKHLLLALCLTGSMGCAELHQWATTPWDQLEAAPMAVFNRTSEAGGRTLLGLVYALDGRVVRRTDVRLAATPARTRPTTLAVPPGEHQIAVGLEYQGSAGIDVDLGEARRFTCQRDGRLEILVRATVRERGARVDLESGFGASGCTVAR